MNQRDDEPLDFAPADLTDGRELCEYQTRWDCRAWRLIAVEAAYLFVLIVGIPVVLFFVWKGSFDNWLDLTSREHDTFEYYSAAWLAGVLGGASFAMKWLYHTVAKGEWHEDRLIWRFAVPPLSGGLALVLAAFVASDLLTILDSRSLSKPAAVVAFSFLVGYFSDNVIGSLLALAERLFGRPRDVRARSAGAITPAENTASYEPSGGESIGPRVVQEFGPDDASIEGSADTTDLPHGDSNDDA